MPNRNTLTRRLYIETARSGDGSTTAAAVTRSREVVASARGDGLCDALRNLASALENEGGLRAVA